MAVTVALWRGIIGEERCVDLDKRALGSEGSLMAVGDEEWAICGGENGLVKRVGGGASGDWRGVEHSFCGGGVGVVRRGVL